MPCHDITDTLKIQLDHDSRVIQYTLRKRTCGGEVGRESLIGGWLKGQRAEKLLSTRPEAVFQAYPTKSDLGQYLIVKHFLAVQSGLAVMLGRKEGGANDHCSVESIEYGPEGMVLTAQIGVEGMTEEIKACRGSCGTKCGSSRM